MNTLVIIGAGFSGTVAAIEFLRTAPDDSKLIIVNRSGQMAKGLAYGTNSPIHLLNVPAGNMTAIVNEPDSYLKYCQLFDKNITASSFTPRKLYGEYLESMLKGAELSAKGRVHFKQICANATHISGRAKGATIKLDNNEEIFADQVILALGHFPPLTPYALKGLQDAPSYISDPWSETITKLYNNDAPILLVGGGLTALDVVSSLKKNNHTGKIYMLSRRGLLPLPHRTTRGIAVSHDSLRENLTLQAPTILNYYRIIRDYLNTCSDSDWRDVVAALRPITSQLWMRLTEKERNRFLRHVQPYWDTHRHRVAPSTYATFEEALKENKISTIAGRIKLVEERADEVELKINLRGKRQETIIKVKHIINCTGPNSNPKLIGEELIRSLISEDLISIDQHDLGINVTDDLAVVDSQGQASTWLTYVGPMLKAKFWEATAVPELRVYASMAAVKASDLFSRNTSKK
ncbi:FAD/NAD(P)-binding protein [Pseudomonas sp. B21-054]|uniref:FAD/NAD(P)-binding protein n=1 Tax=Pseudomonas sp. B21-054 TaxID=2895494 RepID=UPI00222F009A|nr:FAD/NAD(P)-binding protein [Pseudomonas sp. B21-054]UZE19674.1 FAD/NAD(P)-binding protein [Pseudomonas sp. B21-054]